MSSIIKYWFIYKYNCEIIKLFDNWLSSVLFKFDKFCTICYRAYVRIQNMHDNYMDYCSIWSKSAPVK